jgi:hypothetical protein
VHPQIISDYLLSLYWQWRCSCGNTVPFESSHRKAPGKCSSCRHGGSYKKVTRYAQNTVRAARARLKMFFEWAKISRKVIANPVKKKTKAPSPKIRHYPPSILRELCVFIASPKSNPTEALMLYFIIFHAFSIAELREVRMPYVSSIESRGKIQSLADAYCVFVPRRRPSLGRKHAGRPDTRIAFPSAAKPWLYSLLLRFQEERSKLLRNKNRDYLFVVPYKNRHNIPVTESYIRAVVRRASRKAAGADCTPNMLKKTAAIVLADRAGAGVLRWMGWHSQQAFGYTWMPREIILPRGWDEH